MFLVLSLVLFFPKTVFAEELWPGSFDVSISAGAMGTAELILVNDSDTNAKYSIDLLQVDFGETQDELTFIPLDDALASWIILDDVALSLSANTQGLIGLRFLPPENTDEQVVPIGVQVTRLNQESLDIGVQTAIVSLGFITVGSPVESYIVLDTSIETGGFASLPVSGYLSIRNEGERVVIPMGTMRVTSLFGREVASMSINPEGLRVLNGQTRTFTTYWGKENDDTHQPFVIGVFRVDVEIQPWNEGDVFYARQHIVLFPWKGALIVVFIFGMLAWVHKFSRST